MEPLAKKGGFPLYEILLVAVGLAVAASLYTYLYAERYDFVIEAPCDSTLQQCYTRDCSTGDCPPNELSEYRVLQVSAKTFDTCTDNGCSNICTAQNPACIETFCSLEDGEECVGLSSSNE